MDIDGRTIVVTGAASGLGRGVCEYFARRFSCQVLALDVDEAGLRNLESELTNTGILGVIADVASRESVNDAIGTGIERFGRIDACLNFAGLVAPLRMIDPPASAIDLDAFARAVSVNLVGTFNVMAHCALAMAGNSPNADGERGVVVNIASAAAFDGQVGQSAYASSKAGVVGLSLPAARELARHGIRVNCIAPGAFDTPMLRSVPDSVVERITQTVQFPKRMGTIAEIAGLCEHVVRNSYLNGECIRLDGAMRMPPR